jgi:hypothetical protein
MLAIIELDKEDGDRVKALSVELMDWVESLYNKIEGSRSWQPRWVIDILNDMQLNITSVNKGFYGNWLSVFIRPGPKSKRQMLITTETCKVRCVIVFVCITLCESN